MAKTIRLRETVGVLFKGKSITLVAGVEYKNLPKDILDQIPASAKPAVRKRKSSQSNKAKE